MEIKKYTIQSNTTDDVGYIIDVPQAGGCLCVGIGEEFVNYKEMSEEVGLPVNRVEDVIQILFENVLGDLPNLSCEVIGTYEES